MTNEDIKIKVYKDNNIDTGTVVGYRQKILPKDSGIIYSPYIPGIFTPTHEEEEPYMIDGLIL